MQRRAVAVGTALMSCFAAFAAPAASGACDRGNPAASREAELRARVAAYWNARSQADLAAAYELYSPQFRRATSRDAFLRGYQRLVRFPPERTTVESAPIADDSDEAIVRVRLHIRTSIDGAPVVADTFTEERWICVDGAWWKKDEPASVNY